MQYNLLSQDSQQVIRSWNTWTWGFQKDLEGAEIQIKNDGALTALGCDYAAIFLTYIDLSRIMLHELYL